ncbi:MAG: hypothetical protein QNK37_01515 [Acidobacteriota bacterium]|nr:hypothetical protein [Acidobacteriota bacterium]
MGKPAGRPMKYRHILEMLCEEELYTPSTIAEFADSNGLLYPDQGKTARQRVKVAMGRLRSYHKFPTHGDGTVRRTGQRPVPAWFGWRWKLLILEDRKHERIEQQKTQVSEGL